MAINSVCPVCRVSSSLMWFGDKQSPYRETQLRKGSVIRVCGGSKAKRTKRQSCLIFLSYPVIYRRHSRNSVGGWPNWLSRPHYIIVPLTVDASRSPFCSRNSAGTLYLYFINEGGFFSNTLSQIKFLPALLLLLYHLKCLELMPTLLVCHKERY